MNANLSTVPAVGSLVECVGARGWPGTARVVAGHRAPEPGTVWVRECGLHMWPGQVTFVTEWPVARINVVEGA